ncbi:putative protein kinase RLK-Pelle-WAK family [Helianthus annuus]|nr:putative protein kinase RLK-Pelle-WAK family [Helianthus annuus]
MKLFLAYLHVLIFLLLTPAIARYAKTGCSDKCGNVTIPYPFGIGAQCSVNQWYIVDCKNSTPYLSALNHLEVLGVNLENITVTVSMPRFSNCQNPFRKSSQTRSINLGRSPFLFSKPRNKFVFEGCGIAIMMMDNGSVVTGCSTACLNVTPSDRNSCFGNGCCQTAIPRYLKSYSINLTGLERQGEDGGCGSAFLVDETSYHGRLSDPFSFRNNTSYVPVSLLWTLTDSDSDQVTCCHNGTVQRATVDIVNGSRVDTLLCSNHYTRSLEDNPYLDNGCDDEDLASTAIPKYAKTGCNDRCGNVTIPYPFGIGADCSLNQWYIVDCNKSTPYLSAFSHLEVLGVDLEDQIITVSTPKISDCQTPQNSSLTMSIDLGKSPFLISKSHNKFVFEGCGTAAMMDNGSVVTACSTACLNVTLSGETSDCIGIRCCQTAIPRYLKFYSIKLSGLEEEDGACGSAFLVEDETSYNQRRFYDRPLIVRRNTSFVAISLMWTLTDFDQVTCCSESSDKTPTRFLVDMYNGTPLDTLKCNMRYLEPDPYLADGCNSNGHNGYEQPVSEECRRCRDTGGLCASNDIYDLDGLVLEQNFTCYEIPSYYYDLYDNDHKDKTSLGLILGVSISMGVFFLVATSYVLFTVIKKTKERRRRKKFFKRNGGLLLKQQEEADPSFVDKTILFTSCELEKATDNFNENRILGRGGQGTVYKGMLVDGRIVAVKKSKIVDESQLEQFINEVVILSQVNHRNVVKLLGCCLETNVPLLVSEFISNGTLYDLLHNRTDELPISLNMRLQIATEVAGALAYLHSATSIPIYHRDIKTTNILLDDKYRAKVSDFGTSRFVPVDQTHLTTLVKGTFGYLDPEYFQSSQFTEKSDVYSFGVVLLELITRERPISLTRFGEHRSLATHFTLALEEGRVMSIFDATVIKEGTREELMTIANLAMRCLSIIGKHRPTMKEVAMELETIRTSHIPSTIQTNPILCGEKLSMITDGELSSAFSSDEPSSTFLSCNNSNSQ